MSNKLQQLLTAAVIRVLRPLVRVLIRHEMSHAEFSELARRAYVQEAYANFGLSGRKMTYSRVAVLTGLSRKEVVRLVNLDESELSVAPTRAVRVIDGWMQDPEFHGASGKPKPLPLHGTSGSFSALVARYSGDITLGAVVDELERVGVVSRPNKDTVELIESGYIPQADELEKVHVLSVCTADLLHTAVHNLDADTENRRLQRQLTYSDIPKSVADDFRQEATSRALTLLDELRASLTARRDNALPQLPPEPLTRVGLGIYYHEENAADDVGSKQEDRNHDIHKQP